MYSFIITFFLEQPAHVIKLSQFWKTSREKVSSPVLSCRWLATDGNGAEWLLNYLPLSFGPTVYTDL